MRPIGAAGCWRGIGVVDLTDERGNLAAFMLAGLGADVVLIEPPQGSGGRRRGPFAGDGRDPERSLTFWGWNRGKRSVVLDLESDAGRDGLARLCAGADVVIESGAVPIDLAALRVADPALVTVSITAFGSNGPKAAWPATDLTVNAAACQLAMTGDDDRPPVRTAVPQSFLHACSDAAVGALLALRSPASGGGQHVEVSAQRSMLQATRATSWRSRSAGGGEADERRGQDRRARHPAAGHRRRVRLGVFLSARRRAVHGSADGVHPRGRAVRRGDPRQGLAGLSTT